MDGYTCDFGIFLTAKDDQYCSQCPQRDGCRDVYRQLGQSDAPNVVGKVVWAFLLPIVLFIVLLVVLDKWLPELQDEKRRTLTMFGISLIATVAAVWLAKRIERIRNR
jgi:TRAP-type uncharacterized transport system fused permease subunit